MKHYGLFHSIIILSFILTGCGGSSSSTSNAGASSGASEVSENEGADSTSTGSTDTGGADTSGSDASDSSGADDSGTNESDSDGSDSGDSSDGDSDSSEQQSSAPVVTTTTYTYTRVYGGQMATINATITESHKNDPNLASYRAWDYRNPAVIGNDSSAEKVYFLDKYRDPDETAYGQENQEGFDKTAVKKVTYTHSDLSPVRSNQFLKIKSEWITSQGTELSGVIHDKIHSQTFSSTNSSEIVAEELLHIVEDINYREPCDEEHVSLGELGRYISQGYWQVGDKLTISLDFHSPAFQCVDGEAQYLGHANLTSISTSELIGPKSQVTLQGKSFNSVLHYATTEKLTSQDTGNTITDNTSSYYYQLHTGLVASEGTECLISESGKRYCADEREVATNLPTIPVLN